MAMFYRIKNWEIHQHYKDRSPPWIKLHRKLLTSETWVTLDDASRVLAIACMLVAADTNNKITKNAQHLMRVAYLNQLPDFAPLLDVQFIEEYEETEATLADASKTLASGTKRLTRDRDRERERIRSNVSHSTSQTLSFPPGFAEFWEAYPRKIAKGAAMKAFAKLRADDALLASILKAVAAARNSDQWKADGGKWIPHPATWLNGRRWEDEIEAESDPFKGAL